MTWVKNLFFIVLVVGGLSALGYNLVPPRKPHPLHSYDAAAYRSLNLQDTVTRVDRSFEERWANENLHVAEPAGDLAIARRLSLGLMGTTPSLEEIRQFEALPPGERLPWWIDHILNDSRSHDYLAERFTRAVVGTEDGPFLLYRRRRFTIWLAEQFSKHRPYDAIVRDMIAGSGLWTDNPATNFITVTAQQAKKNQPDPERLGGRVTRAFLGLRLDCAQCHNHPFAAWKQADFEGLSAFFGQTHIGFKGTYDGPGEYVIDDQRKNKKRTVLPKVPFSPELLPEKGSRRDRLAAWVTHPQNPYFARATVNRVWAIMMGRPLVDPVDNIEPEGTPGNAPVHPALKILAEDFVEHKFDLRRLIRVIALSRVFQLDSRANFEVAESHENAWSVFPLTRLRPEQVAGSLLQSASIRTLDAEAHIIWRLAKFRQLNDFVKRYGDSGEDEFDGRGGTIPQRLLLMNGNLVSDKTKNNPFNASTRIAWQAHDDKQAVEVAYLAVLGRRPSAKETAHFEAFLKDPKISRSQKLEDLYWTLVNSTEFSWNH